MATRLETIELRTPDDLPLRLDLRVDPERSPRAIVIVAHGFKGFKRWGFFPDLGERLATAGFASIVADFSMNGIGDDPEQFTRLDLFERNTLTREVADLEQVLEWARTEAPLAAEARAAKVGLLGHSRGAIPVMTVGSERPDDVGAVVTWSGVGRALRYTEGQLERWEEDGAMEFTNARTGQRMTMSWDYVVDAREHAGRIEPARCAERMQVPHLILHGTRDMAVSPDEARMLQAGRTPEQGCELIEIEGGTHTFGAVHPYEGSTPHLDRVFEATLGWFDRHLRGGTS